MKKQANSRIHHSSGVTATHTCSHSWILTSFSVISTVWESERDSWLVTMSLMLSFSLMFHVGSTLENLHTPDLISPVCVSFHRRFPSTGGRAWRFTLTSFFSYKTINNECNKYEKLKTNTKDTKNYLRCERVRKEKKNSNILISVSQPGDSRAAELRLKRQQEHAKVPDCVTTGVMGLLGNITVTDAWAVIVISWIMGWLLLRR